MYHYQCCFKSYSERTRFQNCIICISQCYVKELKYHLYYTSLILQAQRHIPHVAHKLYTVKNSYKCSPTQNLKLTFEMKFFPCNLRDGFSNVKWFSRVNFIDVISATSKGQTYLPLSSNDILIQKQYNMYTLINNIWWETSVY